VPSLTHAEAVERARLLTITAYDVRLDLTSATADDETGETFASRAVVRFASAEPGATSFADLKARRVRSITLNGAPLDPSTVTDGRLALPAWRRATSSTVEATMAYRRDGSGLHRAVDPADGEAYVYGQSFLDFAPAVFACFDQPDLKAPISLRVRAPAHWIIVGNGASGAGR
jgi:aminopeptidase N